MRIINKKGQGFNEVMVIVYILMLTFMTISIIFLVRHTSSLFIDTSSTEALTYYNYILYSKDGFSHYDPRTDRVYPGIIDESKFIPATLESSLKFKNTDLVFPGAKFTLTNLKTQKSQIIYWNEKWYRRLDPKTGFLGQGSPNFLDRTIPVVVRGEEEYPALLKIELVVPK